MNKIKLTKNEIYDFIEISEEIKSYPTKHDCHTKVYILKKDNKYYEFSIEYSYNNGIQISDYVDAIEVQPVEKKIIVWEKI